MIVFTMSLAPIVFLAASSFAVAPPPAQDRAAPPRDVRTLALYDVRDLVSDAKDTESPSGPAIAELAAFLRDAVVKDEATEITAQISPGVLVVVGTKEEHDRLNEALLGLRMAATSSYEIRIVLLEADGAPSGEAAQVLDESLDEAVAALEGKANVLNAPRIVTRPLQRAMLSVLDHVKFVKGYTRIEELDGFEGGLAVPEIGEFDDGVTVELLVSPMPKERSGHVRLDLSAKVGKIRRPIPIESTENGPVHRPETTTREVNTSVTVPLGRVIRLCAAPADGAAGGDTVVVLLEVVRVE